MTTATATQTATQTATREKPAARRLDGTPVEPAPATLPPVEQHATNGTALAVVPPAAQAPAARPSSLAAALALAQQRCQVAMCDSINAGKNSKPYASAEAIIRVANAALADCGLATFPLGHMPATQTEVNVAGKEWFMLVFKWEVQHISTGEAKVFQGAWPVLFEKGRSVEDSFSITFTRALAGFLRALLRIEREVKAAAPPANVGDDAKEKRRQEAEARRAQATGATPQQQTTVSPAEQVSATSPPVQATPGGPVAPAAATSPAAPSATWPTQKPGGITLQTLESLQSLRAELFGLLGFGGDHERMRSQWAAIIAKRGVASQNDLTEAQGQEIAKGLQAGIDKAREETQKNGATFP